MNFFNHKKLIVSLLGGATLLCAVGLWTGTLQHQYHLLLTSGPSDQNYFLMDTTRFPEEIPGSVITLRKMKNEYIDDVHLALTDDVRENLSFPAGWPFDSTDYFIRWLTKRRERGELISYAIFDNNDQKLVGAVEIRSFWKSDPGQMGAWLHEDYRGKGRIQEALQLLIKTYFAQTDRTVCEAEIELFNQRSLRAFKKLGFVDRGYHYELGKPTRYIVEYYKK